MDLDVLLQPQSSFYRQLAARAADAGIVVDLMVASATYCDLASLRFLCSMVGHPSLTLAPLSTVRLVAHPFTPRSLPSPTPHLRGETRVSGRANTLGWVGTVRPLL